MRHLFLMFTIAALAVGAFAPIPWAQAQQAVRVFVNGERVNFDQPPVVAGSRVLVPLRGIFERLGATVDWEPATRTVLAVRANTVVELVIGRRTARVNDRIVRLDVPPMILQGRTLVPLRFVSEALGATVQYQEETRTVLIFSDSTGQPPAPPPAGGQQVKGTLAQVRTGDNPMIMVERENVLVRFGITPDTAITRVNVTTNIGGSVSLNALKIGDEVDVAVGANNQAQRVRAMFKQAVGRLDAIAGQGRTLVLTNGQVYRVAEDNVEVLIDGKSSSIGNLKPGMVLTLRLNPESNLVYGVIAETVAGQDPSPARPAKPVIASPQPGTTISSPVSVQGSVEGATKVKVMIDAMLGVRVASAEAAVNQRGRFNATINYQPMFSGWPYVITVVAVNANGLESDPTTIQVRQQ